MIEDYWDWLPSRMAAEQLNIAAKKFNTLFDAVVKGTAEDVVQLIKNGAHVNAHEFGMTPLMLAVRFGTAETVPPEQ